MMNLTPFTRVSNGAQRHLTPFGRLPLEMNRLFDTFLDGLGGEGSQAGADLRLEVSETEDALHVRAEVPGIAPADLEVSLDDGVLVISGEKRESVREEGETRHYSEHRYGQFRRSLKLATPIDADRVKATHTNGVVTIELPKSEAAKPKRITIQAS
jgi:HSP20 family protein